MSHYPILVKIRAESEEDALDFVREELEDTVTEGNRAGFDYFSDSMKILTEKDLPNGTNSFEELEKEYGEKFRQAEIEQNLGMLRDNIRAKLAEKHLPLSDVPLLLQSKDWSGKVDEKFNDFLQERLKSDTEGSLPKNFTELLNIVMEAVTSLALQENNSLNLYLLKEIRQIKECEWYTEKYYILNTLHNHFADLTREYKEGNVYYVMADRHG